MGIIAVLQIQSEEYRFATYYGAKILSIVQEKDYLVITIKQQQLKLTLAVLQKDGHPLMAPHKGLMNRVIREKASTEIYVTLQKNNETLLEQKGSQQDLRKWIICMVLPTKIGDPPLKMAGRSKNEKVLGFVLLQELLLVGMVISY